jgi:hypothetical protein
LSRVRRVVAGGVASALMVSVAAFPALAIGDGKVAPGAGEGCARSESAVGTPQGEANPGFVNTGTNSDSQRVGLMGPVSAKNPGVSTGAEGDEASDGNATENCNNLQE